jgi:hypothetical protein
MPRKGTRRQKEKKRTRRNYPMPGELNYRRIDDSLPPTEDLYHYKPYGNQFFEMRPRSDNKRTEGKSVSNFPVLSSNKPTRFTYYNPIYDDDDDDDDDDERFEIPESHMNVYHPRTGETTLLGGKRGKGKCVKQTTKKYKTRPSPAFPANMCKGKKKLGNDKKYYLSKKNKKGVYTWKKMSKTVKNK